MLKTKIVTDDPTESILSGAHKLYKAVSVTMGPRGRNVIFRKYGKKVAVTHDGVTVARAVSIDDAIEDVGADLLREAAMKLDSTTGDGTTTVTVLSYHLLKAAHELIKQGHNPMKLKLELDRDQNAVLDSIKAAAKTDVTVEDIQAVAGIAAGDKEVGDEVGKLVFDAGFDTPVLLDFNESTETVTEVINGFKIGSGVASPYFLDGSGIRREVEYPKIVVCDATLRDKEDIMPILRLVAEMAPEDRKILIVCTDIAGDALQLALVNRLKGFADVSVVRVPQGIQSQTEYLTDLALSVGGNVLSRNGAFSVLEPQVSDFGSARRVTLDLTEAVVVDGAGDLELVENHAASLRKIVKTSKNASVKKFAQDRLKTLGQKVVVIRVGGQSETDAEERHYRYEDAVGASRSALRHGVVPGGGTLLYAASQETENPLLKIALAEPIKQVYYNAGVEFNEYEGAIKLGYGVNVLNPEFGVCDLVKAGVLDPTESELECVKTAVAIAGLLMTSGAIIVDENEKYENEAEQQITTS